MKIFPKEKLHIVKWPSRQRWSVLLGTGTPDGDIHIDVMRDGFGRWIVQSTSTAVATSQLKRIQDLCAETTNEVTP